MTTQELKNRMNPRNTDYRNSFGFIDAAGEQRRDYAWKIYNAICAGDQEVIAEWQEFFRREEIKHAEKQERVSAHASAMRDVATDVAKQLGITKKALFEGLKKNSRVFNALRFKGQYNIDEIKNILS